MTLRLNLIDAEGAAIARRRAYHRAWSAANPEKVKGYSQKSYEATREARYVATQRWRAANPDKAKASTKKWRAANRAVVNATQQRWLAANPEKAKQRSRKGALKYKYNLTPAQYDAILRAQRGNCALCGRPPGVRPLVVDHDHTTKAVRGLLHQKCNTLVGYLETAEASIVQVAAYLDAGAGVVRAVLAAETL